MNFRPSRPRHIKPRPRHIKSRRARSESLGWQLGAVGIAAMTLLPVGAIVMLAWNPSDNIWPHLVATVLPTYVGNTLILLLGVGVSTLITGVACAHLIANYEFPLRRMLEWLLLLPLAVPAYVIAYVYTDLLEFAGPVQRALREIFNWQLAGEYWFPEVRGMGGAIMLMGLVLYPYVYLLARAAFLEQSGHLYDAGRLLGRGAFGVFCYVSLPVARPAIAVGVALALMETLNDFGAVDFFAVQTLTVGLYDVWLNMNNLGGAAQIAVTMFAFVILLLALEQIGRRGRRFYQTGGRFTARARPTLRGRRALLAFAVCAAPVVFGFLIPGGMLVLHALANFNSIWTIEFRGYAMNSLMVSALASLLCIACALVVVYANRLRANLTIPSLTPLTLIPNAITGIAPRIASLGYAVPGAVLAVGAIVVFAAADNAMDAFMRARFNITGGLLLSGGVFAIVFAYVARFLAVSIGAIESSFGKTPLAMDMAARAFGYGAWQTLRRFHLPMIKNGVLVAGLIVFVDCMKELPATLILRPFNFETLATHVYYLASDEQLERAAPGALLIVLVGLLPVIILSRAISRPTLRADAT